MNSNFQNGTNLNNNQIIKQEEDIKISEAYRRATSNATKPRNEEMIKELKEMRENITSSPEYKAAKADTQSGRSK